MSPPGQRSFRISRPARRASRCWRAAALGFALVCLALVCLRGGGAAAQQAQNGVYAPGEAAVTGFSGVLRPVISAPGKDPANETFIDPTGPSLRIVDLRRMDGPPAAQVVGAPKPITISAALVGQVFGVALDDAALPNIYVAATSAYGLPIVAPGPDGEPQHVRVGGPNATFMPGQWGRDGGPGSIWKIDGATGEVSLFANVMLGERSNSGPALGGLAFDPDSNSLFVADRETGFIHRFGMDGRDLGRYGHGVTGRVAQGLLRVQWNPRRRIDVTRPEFDSEQPSTWNYATPARRVFGLAVHQRRLYYAVAEGLTIWSVGLNADGSFGDDPVIELAAPPAAGATEISKIAFDEQGRMYLAERAAPTGAFDFEALADPAMGRVLRYAIVGSTAGGQRIWQQSPVEYPIGFPPDFRNGNGGVAIGYSYDLNGDIDFASCGGFMWASGEDLRHAPDAALAARLAKSGVLDVNGLQGQESWRIRRDDEPPLWSYFIDYGDGLPDAAARGHMGDIAIERHCQPPQPASIFRPAPPPAELKPNAPPNSGAPIPIGAPVCPPGQTCPPATPVCPPGEVCPPGQPVCPPGEVCPPKTGASCPPGEVCPPKTGAFCPPGEVCPPKTGASCPPGEVCPPKTGASCPSGEVCPPGSGVPVKAEPSCSAGQTPIAPSNFCCDSGQVYTTGQGAQACCSGQVVNGQCQSSSSPPNCTSSATNPNCCASGYVSSGKSCCLASQTTSTGVCCRRGEAPSGPDNSECTPIASMPHGPQCCVSGKIPAGDGACCPIANVTSSGECCSGSVDPKNRASCVTGVVVEPEGTPTPNQSTPAPLQGEPTGIVVKPEGQPTPNQGAPAPLQGEPTGIVVKPESQPTPYQGAPALFRGKPVGGVVVKPEGQPTPYQGAPATLQGKPGGVVVKPEGQPTPYQGAPAPLQGKPVGVIVKPEGQPTFNQGPTGVVVKPEGQPAPNQGAPAPLQGKPVGVVVRPEGERLNPPRESRPPPREINRAPTFRPSRSSPQRPHGEKCRDKHCR